MLLLKIFEKNVVNLLNYYKRNKIVYFVYELINAFFRQINNICYER